jgi:transcriptional regulator of acetoin/glycerol metabolism
LSVRGDFWPGNVRGLENLTEKYMTLQNISQHGSLHGALLSVDTKPPKSRTRNDIISHEVMTAYQRENGNISRTAQRFAIDRNTVKRWLKKKKKG